MYSKPHLKNLLTHLKTFIVYLLFIRHFGVGSALKRPKMNGVNNSGSIKRPLTEESSAAWRVKHRQCRSGCRQAEAEQDCIPPPHAQPLSHPRKILKKALEWEGGGILVFYHFGGSFICTSQHFLGKCKVSILFVNPLWGQKSGVWFLCTGNGDKLVFSGTIFHCLVTILLLFHCYLNPDFLLDF